MYPKLPKLSLLISAVDNLNTHTEPAKHFHGNHNYSNPHCQQHHIVCHQHPIRIFLRGRLKIFSVQKTSDLWNFVNLIHLLLKRYGRDELYRKYKTLGFVSEKVSWATGGAYCTCNCTWGPSQHLRFISGSSRLLTFSGYVKKQLKMHRMNWRSLVIPWILIIDFQSYCLGKLSTSTELGLLRKLIVHSHLHFYIIHYIHIYIRFYVISWWQRRMGIHLIGKRFEKLGSDFKFPRRRMQLGRREVWIKSDVSNSGDTCDASSLWLISLPHIGIKGAVIKPNNGIL